MRHRCTPVRMYRHHNPPYPTNLGVTVAKLRAKANANGGLSGLSHEERQRYGEAVGRAILAKQRSEAHQGLPPINPKPRCASGTWETTGEGIHNAILRKQAAELRRCPGKIRRARSDVEWQSMYRLAMIEKRNRETNVKKEAA